MKNQPFAIECQKCRNPVEVPNLADLFYWSNRQGFQAHEVYCAKCGERDKAPMIKPQPKRIEGRNYVAGWDV